MSCTAVPFGVMLAMCANASPVRSFTSIMAVSALSSAVMISLALAKVTSIARYKGTFESARQSFNCKSEALAVFEKTRLAVA